MYFYLPKRRAEGEGFEPSVREAHGGFQDRCIQPLCHPSMGVTWSILTQGGHFATRFWHANRVLATGR